MTQLEKEYESIKVAITIHGEVWHKEIDKLVYKLKSEVHLMKIKHTNAVQKCISEIKEMLLRVCETLKKCDLLLASKDMQLCFEYKSMNKEYRHSPPKPNIRLPIFTPQKVLPETLCPVFGNLSEFSINRENQDCGMTSEQKPQEAGSFSLAHLKLPLSGFFNFGKQNQSGGRSSPTDSQLLDEAENVSTINTGYQEPYNVACLNNDEIWISGDSSTIKLFQVNQNFDLRKVFSGKWNPLLKSIQTKTGKRPYDITVTKRGFLAYSDEYDRTVNIVNNEKIEELVRLYDWRPLQICSTLSGDLLVMLKSNDNKQTKIARYYGSIQKQTIQFHENGEPLYSAGSHYRYMTENKNMDICVADWRARVVVVVNSAGKLRFRYRGHEPAPKNKLFEPRGITTDDQSRILTADNDNQCVHVIDQDGQFLRFIKCDFDNPRGLCTDSNDNLLFNVKTNKF
ncbi:uncharacterized protein LOC133186237 [Saccostrea echinata]|uniref:uncharacterized protein LOC133186237 n=1 Tax=Saccostrea echinata TaxID=191078 RepID=UPI002A7EAF60|nr:uncharacterized protein LOC133186237 [Saccostrea echinata]